MNLSYFLLKSPLMPFQRLNRICRISKRFTRSNGLEQILKLTDARKILTHNRHRYPMQQTIKHRGIGYLPSFKLRLILPNLLGC